MKHLCKSFICKNRLLLVFLFVAHFCLAQTISPIVFKLAVAPIPKHAGDSLFVAGNFNGWNPHDISTAMLPNKQGVYSLNLILKTTGPIQWKVTRGSWDKVEVDKNGLEISNRNSAAKNLIAENISVAGWKDDFPFNQKQHTASAQVHIMDTAFYLKALGRKRKIWIYLPKDYSSSNKKYPVLYMHDGQNLFDAFTSGYGEWGLDEILDSLSYKNNKSMIVVGIDNLPEKRIQEYNPYDEKDYGNGEGKLYVQSLVQYLKPFVDKHYRTLPNANNTSIAGSSMGGLISLWAVMKYPTVFGNAGIFSPAFWIAPQFKTDVVTMMKNSKPNLFFYCGGAESKTMETDMDSVINNIKANSKATIKRTVVPNGEHNEKSWHLVLPAFLSTIPLK